MVRNPLHLFTAARDHLRYRGTVHQAVVILTEREDVDLRRTYPGIRPRTVVIGNGVDVDRYHPPSDAERTSARQLLSLGHEDLALLFVGHEHQRKGLPVVLDALADLPEHVRLIVVGGSETAVATLRRSAHARGLGARVHAVGSCADPRAYFHAADALVFPSAYESYGLVVLEALASGLPVVATSTGCVPDVVRQGVNGYVVDGSARQIRGRVLDLLREGPASMAHAARRSAEAHSWAAVAREYLAVVDQVVQAREPQPG
jgi:UDP-glucose:(heptosyl)LPS alpha-1,3-glucosyltransferase